MQNASGTDTLYQRAHQTNQVSSASSVLNWPAYNGNQTLGLDPAYQFWLDPVTQNPNLAHITSLPPGVRLALATGTLVTPDFAYFNLLPPADSEPLDFFASFGQANSGTTYNGRDGPLVNGDRAQFARPPESSTRPSASATRPTR